MFKKKITSYLRNIVQSESYHQKEINLIPGLTYIPNYFSEKVGNEILNVIDRNTWFDTLLSRRIQCYGIHYYITKLFDKRLQPMRKSNLKLSELYFFTKCFERDFGIQMLRDDEEEGRRLLNSLPEYYLDDKEIVINNSQSLNEIVDLNNDNIINQCLVQEYYGQSIAKHVDNVQVFGKEIIILSLLNPCEMTFEHIEEKDKQFKVVLEPNSVCVLKDECRFLWKHGIKRKKHDPRRISLTFRHLIYPTTNNNSS
ncbi:hypothetical protein ABK040_008821 [Willaertia magna]